MINFSGGDWIVKALKLMAKSNTLRRMYYAAVLVALAFALSPVLTALVNVMGSQ
ncbi:hypothetical protein [Escherichia coli]|uniref:hypothetical protein n=1 Tax=Escherichia coli TaxID=562 RepID=UPI001F0D78B6|nr:hypothetical protein [Escherichia coli]